MSGKQRKSLTARNREDALLAAVLANPTITRAAMAAGVSERTVRRAMKRPEFARRVADGRRTAIEMAVVSLAALAEDAHDAVKRALNCGVPGVELRAGALVLLESSVRGGEFLCTLNDLKSLQEQLTALVQRSQIEPID